MKTLGYFPFLLWCLTRTYADYPCAQRPIKGESVVCVCNSTYCDTIERIVPAGGEYVVYTSSKEGLRFSKTSGYLTDSPSSIGEDDGKVISFLKRLVAGAQETLLDLDVNTTYQTMKGFGGAVTDAAGINWMSLEETTRQKLIDSYFSQEGLEYTFIRVPIGGCDFSTHAYAYNELPEDDVNLMNFTLSSEDYDYKIPMIKAAIKASESRKIDLLGTTWSPPLWMKSNHDWKGFSRIKPEYLKTYALYHLKFIDLYAKAGLKIWGITTTNEPFNGVIPLARFNSLGWTPKSLANWIADELGPMIRNSQYNDTLILAVDDQRYTIVLWFNWVLKDRPDALNWIDGVGLHWYGDLFTPASFLKKVTDKHPEKFLLGTEASSGWMPGAKSVILGSWTRAEDYVKNIIENIIHLYVGWIDWNLCLDTKGMPNWANNTVDSAIIVDSTAQEFLKQPMYYAMGHFSKFVPKGSKRIALDQSGTSVESVAFLTPENTVTVVICNSGDTKKIRLTLGNKEAVFEAVASSIITVELSQG